MPDEETPLDEAFRGYCRLMLSRADPVEVEEFLHTLDEEPWTRCGDSNARAAGHA